MIAARMNAPTKANRRYLERSRAFTIPILERKKITAGISKQRPVAKRSLSISETKFPTLICGVAKARESHRSIANDDVLTD